LRFGQTEATITQAGRFSGPPVLFSSFQDGVSDVMFVIGIAGGSGSGKTTIVERLLRHPACKDVLSFLPHDAYYFNACEMPEGIRQAHNWDHPDSLDNRLFVEHLDTLRAGRPVNRPVYDFSTHSRSPTTMPVEPRAVLLLEGILLFAVEEVRQRIDLRVFVDTPADLRLLRRALRDVRERGRTFESIGEQYHTTVRPMHQQFVEPGRVHAQLVIPWMVDNPEAVEVLAARIVTASR
jgi:uridine kinase